MKPKPTPRPLWLIICLSALVLLIVFKNYYTQFTARIDLPEKFEHTLYRILITFFVVEIIRLAVVLTYKPQNPRIRRDNFTIGVAHMAKVVYSLMGVVLLLSIFSITVKEAVTTLSLIAAALVLITKDYISNLINGMYLTFARVVNVGDQVQIGTQKGKILDITLTNVHLLNDDDDIVYIPNNAVFSNEIINYTRRDLKKSSIDFEVDPLLVSDIASLEQQCIHILLPFASDIQPGTYALKTAGVKKDAIQLKFQYILNEPLNKELDKKVRRHFIRGVIRLLHGGETAL